jgi:hypothetical protein
VPDTIKKELSTLESSFKIIVVRKIISCEELPEELHFCFAKLKLRFPFG